MNWGWISLGGCLGLAVVLLLNPITLSVVGMIIGAWHDERAYDRWEAQATAEAAAPVCLDAPPVVLARIEDALTSPDFHLRGVRAVHSTVHPGLWVIAADVESDSGEPGPPYYDREDNFAVWHLTQQNPLRATPAPTDAITAVTDLALRVSAFPRSHDTTLNEAATSCTIAALLGT